MLTRAKNTLSYLTKTLENILKRNFKILKKVLDIV